jgi:tricorn protease
LGQAWGDSIDDTGHRLTAILLVGALIPGTATAQIDARMFRYPDVSATQIAFVYAGDIWVVPNTGGVAIRMSSPAGEGTFPNPPAR